MTGACPNSWGAGAFLLALCAATAAAEAGDDAPVRIYSFQLLTALHDAALPSVMGGITSLSALPSEQEVWNGEKFVPANEAKDIPSPQINIQGAR